LTHYARAYVAGVDVGYEVPPALRDACKFTFRNSNPTEFLKNQYSAGNSAGIDCPVAAGTQISTALSLTIDAPVTGVLAGLLKLFFDIKAALIERFIIYVSSHSYNDAKIIFKVSFLFSFMQHITK
jgi:hypothetical protein